MCISAGANILGVEMCEQSSPVYQIHDPLTFMLGLAADDKEMCHSISTIKDAQT